MKKILIIVLLVSFAIQAQTIINNNCSNRTPSNNSGVLFLAVLDQQLHAEVGSSSILNDLSDYGITLSPMNNGASGTGWHSEAAMMLADTVTNPFYNGGTALDFNRADTNFLASTGNAHLATGTNDFTMIVGYQIKANPSTLRILSFFGNNGVTNQGLYFYANSGNNLEADLTSNPGPSDGAIALNTWYSDAIRNNAGTFQLFRNGTASGTPTTETPNISSGNVGIGFVPNQAFTFVWYLTGSISHVAIYNSALSDIEIKDITNLPTGFVSKNGSGVWNPNTPEFFATFADTVGIPIPANYDLGNLSATLQAKSSATDKTLSIWLGTSQTPKTDVLSVTLSEAWASYQFDFGTATLTTTDTLWMASANLSNQISADDVVLIRSDIGFEVATFPDNQQFFGFPKL